MRVLAIDPGYEKVGVAILEHARGKEKLLYSSCIITSKKSDFRERLGIITDEIRAVAKKWQPEMLAIEKLFFNKNQKTAMRVAEARGAILETARSLFLSTREFTPLEIKIAVTGFGRASKNQVMEMVKKLIVIENKIRSDDEYDAIACGLTCLAREKISTGF